MCPLADIFHSRPLAFGVKKATVAVSPREIRRTSFPCPRVSGWRTPAAGLGCDPRSHRPRASRCRIHGTRLRGLAEQPCSSAREDSDATGRPKCVVFISSGERTSDVTATVGRPSVAPPVPDPISLPNEAGRFRAASSVHTRGSPAFRPGGRLTVTATSLWSTETGT